MRQLSNNSNSDQSSSMQNTPAKTQKQFHTSNEVPVMTTTHHQRFNEWDPYALARQQQNMLDSRQKSPLKAKTGGQQQSVQQQSNFAQTFLNTTDSSPRQSSGGNIQRNANNSNSSQKQLQQMSPQHQPAQAQNNLASLNNQIDLNSSANLDLIISGQKLGRKDLSPTNQTPREANAGQQAQQSSQPIAQLQSQSIASQQRPYTRRLQPLDKMNGVDSTATANSNITGQQSDGNSQFLSRLKT
jgi:hypothetical protein